MGEVPGPTVNEILVEETYLRASLVERYTQHQIDLALAVLEARLYDKILARVGAALPRIRSRGSRASASDLVERTKLSGRLRRNQKLAKRHLLNLMAHELREFARDEARWQLRVLQGAIPDAVNLSFNRPAPALLNEIATRHKFQGRRLADWVDNLTKSAIDAVEVQIDQGLVNGESIDEIVSRLRGTRPANFRDGVIPISKRSAERLVRTAVTHTQVQAREATFRENADIIDRVKWVSTLDFRTSQICMSLDGQVFPLDEGPRPPAHPNCRSVVVAIVKSLTDLGFGEFDAGTRASMDGQVPSDTTYEKWLRGQTAAVQDQILGRGKGALFRRGIVPLKRWIDAKNRPLTLAELRRVEDEIRATQGRPNAEPKPPPKRRAKPKPYGENKAPAETKWFEAAFDGADSKVVRAVRNAETTIVRRDPRGQKMASYSRTERRIRMGEYTRDDDEGLLTFRHEYGHRLDHHASERKREKSLQLESAEARRIASMLDVRSRHHAALAAEREAGGGIFLAEMRRALGDVNLADEASFIKVAEKYLAKVPGMSVGDFDRIFGGDFAGRLRSMRSAVALRLGRLDLLHAELLEAERLAAFERLFLSDFFEALTDAEVGFGHGRAYYRAGPFMHRDGVRTLALATANERHSTEAFAEWFSFRSSGDPRHRSVSRLLARIAPKVIENFEEILDGLAASR